MSRLVVLLPEVPLVGRHLAGFGFVQDERNYGWYVMGLWTGSVHCPSAHYSVLVAIDVKACWSS